MTAATTTFTAMSMIRFHFILHLPFYIFHRLVLSQVVTAGLDERLAGDLTRLSVLDGDSLHGSCSVQGECLTVQGALGRRRAAVGGVVDGCTVRTTHAYLSRVGELRVTADSGRSHRRSHRAVATVRTAVRATAGVASVVPIVVTRTTAAAVAVLGGVAAGEALDHRLGLRCEGELGVAVHLLDDGVAGVLYSSVILAEGSLELLIVFFVKFNSNAIILKCFLLLILLLLSEYLEILLD